MTLTSLQQTTTLTLQQLIDLLLHIKANVYTQPIPVLSGSSVGKHIRHITEFYLCLFQGIAIGEVEYDSRKRDPMLETDKDFAIQTLEEIIEHISYLDSDQPVNLKASYLLDNAAVIPTTLYRELIYNLEHCIHHMATLRIAIGTTSAQYVFPHNFGLAPSTIHYRQSSCTQ